jgi:lysophospholipase L1-like esterase
MSTTLCLVLASTMAVAQAPAKAAPTDRWEKAIAAFEAHDKTDPPPRDGVLFAGASSIRLWDVKRAFPDLPCTNRGFGGSQMGDTLRYVERTVIPYHPRVIVVMTGGNDVAAGDTPEQVGDDFQALATKIHAKLPQTKIYYLSLYPSVRRVAIDDKIRKVNELIGAVIKTDPRLGYIDIRTRLSTADGGPRPELLRNDGLHLNDKGYAVCNEIVGPILRKTMKSAAQPASAK